MNGNSREVPWGHHGDDSSSFVHIVEDCEAWGNLMVRVPSRPSRSVVTVVNPDSLVFPRVDSQWVMANVQLNLYNRHICEEGNPDLSVTCSIGVSRDTQVSLAIALFISCRAFFRSQNWIAVFASASVDIFKPQFTVSHPQYFSCSSSENFFIWDFFSSWHVSKYRSEIWYTYLLTLSLL